MDRVVLQVTVDMESYIACPYWPETDDKIEIQKKSGMNRAQSDAKREQALKAYLEKSGLTMDDYNRIVKLSERQWYRIDNNNPESPIVIPRHQISGAIVQTLLNAPAGVRGKYKADSVRAQIRIGDFVTGKTAADGVFDRYVKLEGSNQRSRQKSEHLVNFQATGTLSLEPPVSAKDIDSLKHLLGFALREIGVGASRKMGYGRGQISNIEVSGSLAEEAEEAA